MPATWAVYVLTAAFVVAPWYTANIAAAASKSTRSTAQHHDAIAALLSEAARQVEAGQLDGASATIERALRIDPNDASLWRILAEVRERQGRSAQAATLLAKADALEANKPATALPPKEVATNGTSDNGPGPDARATDARATDARVYRVPVRPRERTEAWRRSEAALAEAVAAHRATQESDEALQVALADQRDWITVLTTRLREAQLERERLLSELHRAERSRSIRHDSGPRRPVKDRDYDDDDDERDEAQWPPQDRRQDRSRRFARELSIPDGHMPPLGMCRIWFPDRPPGRQPPPGRCDELVDRLPAGAILIGQN